MKTHPQTRWLSALAAPALLGGMLALAGPSRAQPAPLPATGTTQVSEERPSQAIPDGQKSSIGRDYATQMREILGKVIGHLGAARQEADVVKLNCVTEKLTSLKGLVKISDNALVLLEEALARRDKDAADHEFEKLALALSKCQQLFAESESCVGELAVYAGETDLDVTIDPNVAALVEEIAAPIVVDPYRPPAASPYQ